MLRRYSSQGLETLVLGGRRTVVGSAPNCDIAIQASDDSLPATEQIQGKDVASVHASIEFYPVTRSFWLKDHSLAGFTSVNGEPVVGQARIELRNGDLVQIASAQPLVFENNSLVPLEQRISPIPSSVRSIAGSRAQSKSAHATKRSKRSPSKGKSVDRSGSSQSQLSSSGTSPTSAVPTIFSNLSRRSISVGNNLLQRVVKLQAEVISKDEKIPLHSGSGRPESSRCFELHAYRAFLGAIVAELRSFNERTLRTSQRDYSEIFLSIVRSIEDPFSVKMMDIEKRVEEVLAENDFDEVHVSKLRSFLRDERKEKITALSAELEVLLPVIRDAAAIARESIRVCNVFTQWSRQLGDSIRTTGITSGVLLSAIDDLKQIFIDSQMSRHWLPPSVTPLLRLAALEIEKKERGKVRGHREVQTDWTTAEINDHLTGSQKLAKIIEDLENDKVLLRQELDQALKFGKRQSLAEDVEVEKAIEDTNEVEQILLEAEDLVSILGLHTSRLLQEIQAAEMAGGLEVSTGVRLASLYEKVENAFGSFRKYSKRTELRKNDSVVSIDITANDIEEVKRKNSGEESPSQQIQRHVPAEKVETLTALPRLTSSLSLIGKDRVPPIIHEEMEESEAFGESSTDSLLRRAAIASQRYNDLMLERKSTSPDLDHQQILVDARAFHDVIHIAEQLLNDFGDELEKRRLDEKKDSSRSASVAQEVLLETVFEVQESSDGMIEAKPFVQVTVEGPSEEATIVEEVGEGEIPANIEEQEKPTEEELHKVDEQMNFPESEEHSNQENVFQENDIENKIGYNDQRKKEEEDELLALNRTKNEDESMDHINNEIMNSNSEEMVERFHDTPIETNSEETPLLLQTTRSTPRNTSPGEETQNEMEPPAELLKIHKMRDNCHEMQNTAVFLDENSKPKSIAEIKHSSHIQSHINTATRTPYVFHQYPSRDFDVTPSRRRAMSEEKASTTKISKKIKSKTPPPRPRFNLY
ncbi:unnamed protein product [Caenorhabditis auriculariae]|uniref:FHA domain-containing protein n=1 Tax=Caenorhabditis auriculariae TaxID=2777116 RepID=A0A8S1GZT6_9PELO|nr:unnamed protein product [Caenorhabditis auriculariae]